MRTATVLASLTLLTALPEALPAQGGAVFEKVVRVLGRNFYDRDFRRNDLPALAERYRAAAAASETLHEERVVIHAMLKEIPATHLALYSKRTHQSLLAELFGSPRPTFGFQLVQRGGRFYAATVLDDGPAHAAGIRAGDRVLSLDGVFPGRSELLDWRSDDAHLPDPPLHAIIVPEAGALRVRVARGERARDVELEAKRWNGVKASKASVKVVERGGLRLGYVHIWYVFNGSSDLLSRALRRDLAQCDGVVVDLRGRGGNAAEAIGIVNVLRSHKRRDGCPVVALIDTGTRSAKEMISHDLKRRELATLVGKRTAGAVVPATFEKVGPQSVLMYPAFAIGRWTRELELKGVEPDVAVAGDVGGGKDPILEAGWRVLAAQVQERDARGKR